ncbi:glycosyltransferase family 2 protein [Teredinibacter haidensis]|uniref:glycosyltransferase family 2 protein n=1 Tax=Teredinibacter haidensis TaxID=2731755 RepID=UPI000948F06A|nr:glycosyltransferase family 2 protein [Teredinibacter haidensis]
MLVILFWIAIFFTLYSYFIYPIALKLIVFWGGGSRKQVKSSTSVNISLLITAYNEKDRIGKKLENTLKLEYDHGSLEVIVASDCSDDGTDNIVRTYEDRGVSLVRAAKRLGKENAQLAAIKVAQGEILVFSDTATDIPPDALNKLAAYFSDESIGAVSSEDRFVAQDGSLPGEGAYVKYEMWLRQQESRLAGLVGLSGSFFAARKEVCQEWDIHSPSDFNTALNSVRLGYKAITAPDVLGYYQDLKDSSKEYSRKIRTVIRGMTALRRHPGVLDPTKYGLFSFQVWSHKLMRWLVPWSLLVLFVVSAFISGEGQLYQLALLVQIVFYGIAIAAHFNSSLLRYGVVKLIYFFVQVNIALFDASIKFFSGTRMTTWKPSAR